MTGSIKVAIPSPPAPPSPSRAHPPVPRRLSFSSSSSSAKASSAGPPVAVSHQNPRNTPEAHLSFRRQERCLPYSTPQPRRPLVPRILKSQLQPRTLSRSSGMSDSATISLLPVSLSIVHVPRSRIHDLFHPLLRQLLLPGPAFLNLTCNELELSLFAEHHVLRDFQPIAQKDARKLLARAQARDAPALKSRKIEWEPIEFSAERWNVLQIDSHSDAHGESGPLQFPPSSSIRAQRMLQAILVPAFTSCRPL